MTDYITLKDIIAETGAKTRLIQFWADRGALKATDDTNMQGRGTHRLYPRGELTCARLGLALDKFKIPVGVVTKATAALRDGGYAAKVVVLRGKDVALFKNVPNDPKEYIGDGASAMIVWL